HRAVGGGLARAEAEPPLARDEQLAAAPELAAHSRANPDGACPGRGEPELPVVRRHAPHPALRDAQVRRDRLQRLWGEIAFGALDRLERRQEPRPFAGKLRQELGHCHRREAYHAPRAASGSAIASPGMWKTRRGAFFQWPTGQATCAAS